MEFCSGRDAYCSNVVGVVIIQNEDITIAARRWNEERAGLICGNVTGRCKAGSIDMVGLGWIGLDGIVDEVRSGIGMVG